VDKSVSAIVSH